MRNDLLVARNIQCMLGLIPRAGRSVGYLAVDRDTTTEAARAGVLWHSRDVPYLDSAGCITVEAVNAMSAFTAVGIWEVPGIPMLDWTGVQQSLSGVTGEVASKPSAYLGWLAGAASWLLEHHADTPRGFGEWLARFSGFNLNNTEVMARLPHGGTAAPTLCSPELFRSLMWLLGFDCIMVVRMDCDVSLEVTVLLSDNTPALFDWLAGEANALYKLTGRNIRTLLDLSLLAVPTTMQQTVRTQGLDVPNTSKLLGLQLSQHDVYKGHVPDACRVAGTQDWTAPLEELWRSVAAFSASVQEKE